jgi:hypothetical protein
MIFEAVSEEINMWLVEMERALQDNGGTALSTELSAGQPLCNVLQLLLSSPSSASGPVFDSQRKLMRRVYS